jgi:hypothetical protein
MSDLSGWEVVSNDSTKKSKKPTGDLAGWSVVPQVAPSEQQEPESFGKSLMKAPFRVGEDLYKRAANLVHNAPSYWNQAKTEVPAALNPAEFWSHPGHSSMQAFAGANEAVNYLNHVPVGLAKYANERLHLLPKSVPDFLNKMTPDSSEAINDLFGKPKYPGEAFTRGAFRHAPDLVAGSILNPMKLTHAGIAKKVVNTLHKQEAQHTHMYNNLWKVAEREGIDTVPVSNHLIDTNLKFIKQYKTPREYGGLEEFRNKPTLQNAQAATSDLKGMMRGLHEKSKTSSLTSEEKHLYDAAEHTINHIEGNMFLKPNGEIHQPLANLHKQINGSYRENVVPYKYNKDIQDFIDRKKTPSELVNSLSRGEFAVKKGSKHPAIKIRNSLPSILSGLGTVGGIGWLGNKALSER